MLNKSHAAASSLINKVMWHMIKMNLKGARLARYTRLLALHAAGGGWMSDYDVANLGFSAGDATAMEKDGPHLIVGEPSYLFHATKDQLNFLLKKLHDLPLASANYPVESEVLQHSIDSLVEVKTKLFHAKKGQEKSPVEQMAEAINPTPPDEQPVQ